MLETHSDKLCSVSSTHEIKIVTISSISFYVHRLLEYCETSFLIKPESSDNKIKHFSCCMPSGNKNTLAWQPIAFKTKEIVSLMHLAMFFKGGTTDCRAHDVSLECRSIGAGLCAYTGLHIQACL